MYRALIEAGIADDAWLPTTLVLVRPTRRHASGEMREQWRCVLPRTFFASIPIEKRHHLAYLRDRPSIARDSAGAPIVVPSDQVEHYRAALNGENRERAMMASRLRHREKALAKKVSWNPSSRKKKPPSKRLKNAGKVADEIRGWKSGFQAAETAPQIAD